MMRLPRPLLSFVTHGEVRAFAEQNQWRDQKLSQMEFLLDYFDVESIESRTVLDAYALLDTFSRRARVRMGKNICGLPRPRTSGAHCL